MINIKEHFQYKNKLQLNFLIHYVSSYSDEQRLSKDTIKNLSVKALIFFAYLLEEYGPQSKSPKLTYRQIEVLLLSAIGCGVEEIAEKLNLGVQTIKNYRQKIMYSLEVSTLSEAVFNTAPFFLPDLSLLKINC